MLKIRMSVMELGRFTLRGEFRLAEPEDQFRLSSTGKGNAMHVKAG
jgi:hypothetical protein